MAVEINHPVRPLARQWRPAPIRHLHQRRQQLPTKSVAPAPPRHRWPVTCPQTRHLDPTPMPTRPGRLEPLNQSTCRSRSLPKRPKRLTLPTIRAACRPTVDALPVTNRRVPNGVRSHLRCIRTNCRSPSAPNPSSTAVAEASWLRQTTPDRQTNSSSSNKASFLLNTIRLSNTPATIRLTWRTTTIPTHRRRRIWTPIWADISDSITSGTLIIALDMRPVCLAATTNTCSSSSNNNSNRWKCTTRLSEATTAARLASSRPLHRALPATDSRATSITAKWLGLPVPTTRPLPLPACPSSRPATRWWTATRSISLRRQMASWKTIKKLLVLPCCKKNLSFLLSLYHHCCKSGRFNFHFNRVFWLVFFSRLIDFLLEGRSIVAKMFFISHLGKQFNFRLLPLLFCPDSGFFDRPSIKFLKFHRIFAHHVKSLKNFLFCSSIVFSAKKNFNPVLFL